MNELGEPAYRGEQLFSWVHAKGVLRADEMTNLPSGLREVLAARLDLSVPAVRARIEAGDGTTKITMGLHDGFMIETVLIPRSDEAGGVESRTVCVSSQVGCAVRCRFCRSGQEGFKRNLDAAEIVAQVHAVRWQLCQGRVPERVVFMGIGEPLDNIDEVVQSIRILADERGAAIPTGRITVSTVGNPEAIRALALEFGGKLGLALSLHSVIAQTRAQLIGSRNAPDVREILSALREYPLGTRERVTVEIVLVAGLNDTPAEAAAMALALHGLRCRVNIIPLNPFDGLALGPPAERSVLDYQKMLSDRGFPTFVRRRMGDGILAACGQLAFGRQ
jgi:23S rRNA (adenine2503-C2)-methyltransferase